MELSKVNAKQVGGTHYNQVQIQHWDLVVINKLPYLEAQITKYVTRWQKKNGVQDVEKAIHYFEKLESVLDEGLLILPTDTLTSIQSPRVSPPIKLEEFRKENGIGDVEHTLFHLLLTYQTRDELYRAGVLLQHLLCMAQEKEDKRTKQDNVRATSAFGQPVEPIAETVEAALEEPAGYGHGV